MALPGWFGSLWLTRFSRPAGERPLWRHLLRTPPKRILEIGLGGLSRTERMLSLLGPASDGTPIQYVGIDRFESRTPTDPPGVTLKAALASLSQARPMIAVFPSGNQPTNCVQLPGSSVRSAASGVGWRPGSRSIARLVATLASRPPGSAVTCWV